MTHQEAKERIAKLSADLEKYNYHYYILSESLVSDYEFDKMLEELQTLEKDFPDLQLPHSPSPRVGGAFSKGGDPMIILVTDIPGSSKTAKVVDLLAHDPQFQGRPLFSMGVPELKLEHQSRAACERVG